MRRYLAAVLGLTLMGATLAACGSSSKSTSEGTGATTTTESSGGGGGGGGSDEFSQIVAQASKAKIKITYKQSNGDTVTIAQDGNGKSAYTSGGSTIYSDGSSTVSCEGTGADAKCTQLPIGGAGASILTVFTQLFSGLTKLNSSVYGGHVSSDTIAGRDARCVTFKASDFAGLAAIASGDVSDPSAEATICVDKDTGFLLKLESKSNNSTKDEFLATDVGEPSDSDFTPPVTPETLPNISIPGITVPQ